MRSTGEQHFEAYEDYARTLRIWLVAYGVGGPVLLLTNEEVWRKLADSPDAATIAYLFFAGVLLQTLVALLNKATQWIIYYGKTHEGVDTRRSFKISRCIGRQFWIDLGADLGSILLFGIATFWVMQILLGN